MELSQPLNTVRSFIELIDTVGAMMRGKFGVVACFIAGVIFSGVSLPAGASTVTEEIAFTAEFLGPPRIWDGTFTVTFDPSVSSSGALDNFASNLPSKYGTFSYVYGSGGYLIVGNNCTSGGCSATTYENQAYLSIHVDNSTGFPVAGSTWAGFVLYPGSEAALESSDYYSISGPYSMSIAAVPEPSTWVTLLLGFAGLGFVAYRHRAAMMGAA